MFAPCRLYPPLDHFRLPYLFRYFAATVALSCLFLASARFLRDDLFCAQNRSEEGIELTLKRLENNRTIAP